jgi:hypothetical protein
LAAASVLFAVGVGLLGLLWMGNGTEEAQASTINFGIMLDEVTFDARGAFRRFLAGYHGREVSMDEARHHGRDLSFEVPALLPHGFSLRKVYTLRFGDSRGVAAEYLRGEGEFLGMLFHPPIQEEDYGTHEDHPAVIGKHRGHKVEVGEWSLVHLTDPTTCHCVLSRLDEVTELPGVLAAVAPEYPVSAGQ